MRKVWIVVCALLLFIPAAYSQNPQPAFSSNASVTIAVGGTYQQVRPPTQAYNSLTVQNNNTTTDNCFLELTGLVVAGNTTATSVVTTNGTVTAQQASILIQPGGSYQRYYPKLPRNAIMVTCATAGDSFYVDFQP
jgi:hypothetical protein